MKVCIVGTGYIGLPTALMLASHGVDVESVGHRQETVDKLRRGDVTFEEKGLPELFAQARESGHINFRIDYPTEDFYIITVPTPYLPDSKKVDAAAIVDALRHVLAHCNDGAIIVVESTISPGTIDREVRPVVAESGKKVHLAHAPERIIPGNMLNELIHNSRTIGCDDKEIGEKIKSVYLSFCQGDIVITDIKTAEMTKVVENTFRDINIAFANELAKICRKGGMDVNEVIRIANKHPRVNILQPGPGVGGHCISIDPWFLVGDFPEEAQLIRTAREINSGMPAYVLGRIESIMQEKGLHDYSRIGLYGLTYKENVDDTRESPTLQLLEVMEQRGLPAPLVYDPMVSAKKAERQCFDYDEFLNGTDIVVILVGHSHIRERLDSLKGKVVLDTRSIIQDSSAYTL
jgi:UDP-N-acetyl-D-mannosaminuronic acid dehydrogenase